MRGIDPPTTDVRYVDAPDVRLASRTVGDRGEVVVVVHGGPGLSMAYFGDDLAELSADHTLLYYDQRGSGASTLVSEADALHVDRFVDDLDAVRRHLDRSRLTLLAHSWGAAVAALYAQRWPERVERLVIVGGIPLRRADLVRAFDDLRDARDASERRAVDDAAAAWRADPGDASACRAFHRAWFRPFFADPDHAERSTGDFCAGAPAALANKLAAVDRFTMASLGDWDWRSALATVTARTLVVHGTVDPIPLSSARAWAAALPHARLVALEGVGHFPYLEAPARFFPAVRTFLAGGWPDGSVECMAP
jgi:proline iminopeptidase